ncbi:aspartate carbamoyltransferase regulatory subunit [Ferrimonas sediminum]|uniref:Aspartate carbamoyltransferase regulatory chain n=1 Tax=Ferrimonas sediminum TaxID=718193 RepID=A0A1G8M6L0_9GAMM|nr:aspartate carbamoyltransferase regulatory subunit [Ferrimonas sediminum]SDI63493.1 aspartate carbamoyltransferase regulatory subunit [Ferrimonas sediminum]
MAKNKLKVEAIERGTVIDHIPAGMGVRILKFFQLTDKNERITVGLNLRSGDEAKKDLIKVENTVFTVEQANQLALFASEATINEIRDFAVVNKYSVQLPESIDGVLRCPNSNCITHHEPAATRFYVKQKPRQTDLKCHFCEKSFHTTLFSELN